MLETNKKISAATGFTKVAGLNSFMNQFRDQAKKNVKDNTDLAAVNNEAYKLFQDYLKKVGKEKVVAEMEKIAEEIKKKKTKK